jgi:hypothetical protein
VRDQTSAVIPSAAVTLTSKDTNITSKTIANQTGFYLFPGLVPGPYLLTVEAVGMQKFEGALTVQVEQSAVVDVTMKVGQTTAEVSVQDVTPLVTVDNATLGGTLEHTRIEQLPLNGRAVMSLLQTVPGMEGTRAFGTVRRTWSWMGRPSWTAPVGIPSIRDNPDWIPSRSSQSLTTARLPSTPGPPLW